MRARAALAGLALFTALALAGSASAAPSYIEAAVQDPGRPAADTARDANPQTGRDPGVRRRPSGRDRARDRPRRRLLHPPAQQGRRTRRPRLRRRPRIDAEGRRRHRRRPGLRQRHRDRRRSLGGIQGPAGRPGVHRPELPRPSPDPAAPGRARGGSRVVHDAQARRNPPHSRPRRPVRRAGRRNRRHPAPHRPGRGSQRGRGRRLSCSTPRATSCATPPTRTPSGFSTPRSAATPTSSSSASRSRRKAATYTLLPRWGRGTPKGWRGRRRERSRPVRPPPRLRRYSPQRGERFSAGPAGWLRR